MPGLHSACTGSDAVVDDVDEVPEELHAAPGEHDLGPDGGFLQISHKVNFDPEFGEKDDHYMFKLKV